MTSREQNVQEITATSTSKCIRSIQLTSRGEKVLSTFLKCPIEEHMNVHCEWVFRKRTFKCLQRPFMMILVKYSFCFEKKGMERKNVIYVSRCTYEIIVKKCQKCVRSLPTGNVAIQHCNKRER